MAELFSRWESGLGITAGTMVGSVMGASGLNDYADRLNSLYTSQEVWLPFRGYHDVEHTVATGSGLPLTAVLLGSWYQSKSAQSAATSWFVPDNYNNVVNAKLYVTDALDDGASTGSITMYWGTIVSGTDFTDDPNSSEFKFTFTDNSTSIVDVTNIVNSGLNAGSLTTFGLKITNSDANAWASILGMRINYI